MSDLGDVFGSDFEKKYNQKEQMRQEQRRKVDKESLMEACWHAVEGDGFDGEEPRFTFDAGEVEYDVLLMQAPENNMQKFIHEFGDDGQTLGMFHLGELFSCAFLGDMQKLISKVEQGEHYIVVGTYQENPKENSSEVYYNINPVAGIAPIAQAKKYADKMDEQMQGSSIQEQAEQQSEDEQIDDTDDEDDDMDLDGLDDEDDKPDEEDVVKVFKVVSNKKEQIIRDVAGGDDNALEKLTGFVNKNTSGNATEEYIADTFEEHIQDIEGRGEDEEDNMDLGDLDDDEDDNDDEMDLGGDDEEYDEPEATDEEDNGGDDEGVEDWF